MPNSLTINLLEELQRPQTKTRCVRIVQFVGKDKNRFDLLIACFLKGPYRITQHAAWPISYCIEDHPSLATPHLRTFLKLLRKPDVHPAVKRNILRLLEFVKIPKHLHAGIIEVCFAFLLDPKEPIAVHAFSISVLAQLLQLYPGMKGEFKIVLEDRLLTAGPAVRSRALKALKQFS
jgi:hypothetical protein